MFSFELRVARFQFRVVEERGFWSAQSSEQLSVEILARWRLGFCSVVRFEC